MDNTIGSVVTPFNPLIARSFLQEESVESRRYWRVHRGRLIIKTLFFAAVQAVSSVVAYLYEPELNFGLVGVAAAILFAVMLSAGLSMPRFYSQQQIKEFVMGFGLVVFLGILGAELLHLMLDHLATRIEAEQIGEAICIAALSLMLLAYALRSDLLFISRRLDLGLEAFEWSVAAGLNLSLYLAPIVITRDSIRALYRLIR